MTTICTRCNQPIPKGWEYDDHGKPVHASWPDCVRFMQDAIDALQKFKDFTHDTLDTMDIPHDPPGPHKDAGCRIGQRLEWIKVERTNLRKAITEIVGAALPDPNDERDIDLSWLRGQIRTITKKYLKDLAPKS